MSDSSLEPRMLSKTLIAQQRRAVARNLKFVCQGLPCLTIRILDNGGLFSWFVPKVEIALRLFASLFAGWQSGRDQFVGPLGQLPVKRFPRNDLADPKAQEVVRGSRDHDDPAPLRSFLLCPKALIRQPETQSATGMNQLRSRRDSRFPQGDWRRRGHC